MISVVAYLSSSAMPLIFNIYIFGRSEYLYMNCYFECLQKVIQLSIHIYSFFYSYIEGTIPGSLGGLVKLQELFIDDNELTGSIPTELGRLVNANYICLASNNLGEFEQAETYVNYCCVISSSNYCPS